jgi:capsular exopolysaccharide synthesis family protein
MNEHTPRLPRPSQPGGGWSDQFLPHSELGANNKRIPLLTAADIRGILFRQRMLIAGAIGVALLAGLIFTLLKTPIYEANSTVRIDPWGTNIVEGQDIAPGLTSNEVYRYMETQGSVIESKRLARRVMEMLNLAESEKFLSAGFLNDRPENLDDAAWLKHREDRAITKLQANVEAEVPLSNRIVPIKFRSDSPELAAGIANAYSDAFVRDDAQRNLQVNRYAQEYLQEQIGQIRGRVQAAEMAANDYARRNGIVSQTTGVDANDGFGGFSTFYGPTITGSNLASINESYVRARAERIVAEQRWLAIANTPAAQIREVQESRVIQDLEQTRFELLRQLSDLQQRYDDSYPAVREILAQIDSIDGEIARVGNEIKNGIRNQFEIAAQQERGMQMELNNASSRSLVEQDKRVRHNLLEREAAALRTQLASLLNRFNEISTAANIQTGNITKLDDADIPTSAVSPNLLINLIISLFGGVALAGALVVLRETFDDRLRSFEEIEDRLGFPLIGHTPFVEEGSVDEQLNDTFSPLAEAYSSILTNLDYSIPRDRNVIQFTSSQASEGKTTTALTLAKAFARQGRKTLLVDADLRKPSMAHHFGHRSPDAGIAEILLGHVDQESTYLSGTPENLDVIPVGNTPPNPVDLLSTDKIAEFIERNREDYSMVIFDTSPVMGIADAALIARHVDATIFVVEANRVQFGQARASLRRLRATGASIAGIVLSKYRALQAGESYDYQYQYYVYSPEKRHESAVTA